MALVAPPELSHLVVTKILPAAHAETDFIAAVRRERTSRLLLWKQTHPKIPRMQSCCLQLPHQHPFPGTTGAAVPLAPSPAQGEAPWFLASSGQDPQHHHSTGTSMELAVCAPLERCSQSVCASQTPELCCIWLLRPSRSLPGERQPQQLKSQPFTRPLLHGWRSWGMQNPPGGKKTSSKH